MVTPQKARALNDAAELESTFRIVGASRILGGSADETDLPGLRQSETTVK
jgi:hypothetical protein